MKAVRNLQIVFVPAFLLLLTTGGPGAGATRTPNDNNDNKVIPGKFVIEPPTLISLGFEWYIDGDDNHNARVDVSYRKKGENEWKGALPLLRLQRERVTPALKYEVPNMFAGTIFDLEPDTVYECRFSMSDPDGVGDNAVQLATVRTRAEPRPFAGKHTLHVYPPGYKGVKIEPSFTGLNAAYQRVEPGDVVLVHAGLYQDDRFRYGGVNHLGLNFHGTYFFNKSGTPERPIVLKAADDGEAVFDGNGCYNLFNVMAANYNYFEGLTIRNTEIAFLAGLRNVLGCSGLVVMNCHIENIGIGVTTDYYGSKNFYIADNTIIGREDLKVLMGWTGHTWANLPGFPEGIRSFVAVNVLGQGHVVCYNYIAGFHDGIDVDAGDSYYNPEELKNLETQGLKPVAIDFYNNDIFHVSDNCIETDPVFNNIRVLRNRCMNSAHRPLSSQVVLGGPAYFIRNVVYHAPEGGSIKFYYRTSGMVVYHNTLCSEVLIRMMDSQNPDSNVQFPSNLEPASNMQFRNNLILGQGAAKEVLFMDTYTNYTTSDYDGFCPNEGVEFPFVWNSPRFSVLADYVGPRETRSFRSLPEFSRVTGQEQHGILVDYSIFRHVERPDPKDPRKVYKAADLDFQLRPDAVAVDAGCPLANVNDGFTGKAPDLGAYEVGLPLPHYGPRSTK
jgi:hypothetical protein